VEGQSEALGHPGEALPESLRNLAGDDLGVGYAQVEMKGYQLLLVLREGLPKLAQAVAESHRTLTATGLGHGTHDRVRA
jgi:hypothetical protein